MAISKEKRFELLSFDIANLPLDEDGTARIDFYVHLPRNDRFICFVLQGDEFGEKHTQILRKHVEPEIFCKFSDFKDNCKDLEIPENNHNMFVMEYEEDPEGFKAKHSESISIEANPETEATKVFSKDDEDSETEEKKSKLIVIEGSKEVSGTNDNDKNIIIEGGSPEQSSKQSYNHKEDSQFSKETRKQENVEISGSAKSLDVPGEDPGLDAMMSELGKEKGEFLKKAISKELNAVFKVLSAESVSEISLEDSPIEEISKKLMEVIAPEVDNLRQYLKKIPNYVGVMDDSAAITAIATLFCIARGQTSRSIFREISYAVLLMDISLGSLSPGSLDAYYVNPNQLSSEDKQIVFNHPRQSYEMVQKRFKNLPEIVSQLILGHHELFNGKGYPRKVRSELLAPLVRILAFAVDVFEIMKRAYISKQNVTVLQAVESLLNADVAPHERRHNIVLMREICAHLKEDS